MKKKILLLITSLSAVLSLVCLFLPFFTIEKYKSVSGLSLIFHLFQKFEIPKVLKGDSDAMFFTSLCMPLALMTLLLLTSLVLYVLYYKKKNVTMLNIATLSAVIAFILYGVQLSNSNTLPTDFFGNLLDGTPYAKGKYIFQVADGTGVSIGIGAKLIVISLLIAAVCAILYRLTEYIDKVEHEKVLTPFIIAYRQFVNNKLALTGLFVLLFVAVVCFYGPVFSNYSLLNLDVNNTLKSPSFTNLLGTDDFGRDEFTRVLYGGRISMTVGFVAVLLEVVLGTLIGGIAGYYKGHIDNFIMRIVDIFLCLPFLPIVIIFGAVMSDLKVDPQSRIYFVMLILGFLSWPGFARLLRGQILSLREQEFLVAEEVLGISDRRKILRHLIPNAMPMVMVQATLDFGGMILTETVLSFLGLGVSPPYPSWGNLVQSVEDINILTNRPWMWVPAGLCILIVILAINIAGDGLRDALDPKMKR